MFDLGDKGEREDTSSELRQNDDQTSNPNTTTDHNSTESNDTGYISSASSSCHDRYKLITNEYDEDSELPEIRNTFQQTSQIRLLLSHVQALADNIRQYVPLVCFFPRVGKDISLFAVQICLVENSDELVKLL